MSAEPVEYVTDTDYLTVDDEAPVSLLDGTRHVQHEACPGPRPAPPIMPRVPRAQPTPPRRTKRLKVDQAVSGMREETGP